MAQGPKKSDHLEVVDTTGLTDADWAEINKLKSAYDARALNDLVAKDPVRAVRVLGAFFLISFARPPKAHWQRAGSPKKTSGS